MKPRVPGGISRRQLPAAILAPAPLLGQVSAPIAEELAAARQRTQTTTQALRKLKIPTATEPSFTFKP